MRLSKYLSTAGVASRRRAEEIIASGRVAIDGKVITLPQHRVKGGEEVTVDGRAVQPAKVKQYLLLDKPAGFLCTVTDPHGRPTVLDLINAGSARLYPVGRLDLDTTGLLLLTDDGELAYRLTHPRFGVRKIQRQVKGSGRRRCVVWPGYAWRRDPPPPPVRLLRRKRDSAHLEITLIEGRKRQIKRICAAVESSGAPPAPDEGLPFLTAAGTGKRCLPPSQRRRSPPSLSSCDSILNDRSTFPLSLILPLGRDLRWKLSVPSPGMIGRGVDNILLPGKRKSGKIIQLLFIHWR